MKKVKFIIFIVVVCFMLGSFLTASADTIDMEEDFSAYPPGPGSGGFTGGAIAGVATATIEANVNGHTNVLQVETLANPTMAMFGATATTASTQITSVEFDILSNSAGATGGVMGAYAYSTYMAGVQLMTDGRLYALEDGVTMIDIGAAADNTWYTVRMELDYASETFDVYIDGTLAPGGSNISMDIGSASATSNFMFAVSSSAGTVIGDIDNIRIISISPPPAVNPQTGDSRGFRWIIYVVSSLILLAGMLTIKKKKYI